jgi:predicted transcriptional regulator of viral defense system
LTGGAPTTSEILVALTRSKGALTPKDVRAAGIHPEYLRRLHARGVLERSARGVYTLAEGAFTEHHDLVEVVRRVPNGVICLLSALFFHEIGTQLPYQVWVAIDVKAWPPRGGYPPIRLVRFSGRALTEGIETHEIEGVQVPVYNVAKTVADCFKYRNKIGLDVALEALREVRRDRRATMDELWYYAEVDRMRNVMRPYLESLV